MATEAFISRNFSASSQATIDFANGILDEYRSKGFDLSLRQLYYQAVARGYIENTVRSYKNLGNLVSDARLAGLIDWGMIKDRGRVQVVPPHWNDPADILDSAAASYRIDKWENQTIKIVVLIEKQALEGVLIPTCRALDVTFMANRGYSSSSAMYELGKDLQKANDAGHNVVVLYLGDHDPSGIDMTRDVDERLNLFASRFVKVERLALNYDQIEALDPPPNPAKDSDSRFANYTARFGEESWELDAIEPTQLASMVTTAVEHLRDDAQWGEDREREEKGRKLLKTLAQEYRKERGKG